MRDAYPIPRLGPELTPRPAARTDKAIPTDYGTRVDVRTKDPARPAGIVRGKNLTAAASSG